MKHFYKKKKLFILLSVSAGIFCIIQAPHTRTNMSNILANKGI